DPQDLRSRLQAGAVPAGPGPDRHSCLDQRAERIQRRQPAYVLADLQARHAVPRGPRRTARECHTDDPALPQEIGCGAAPRNRRSMCGSASSSAAGLCSTQVPEARAIASSEIFSALLTFCSTISTVTPRAESPLSNSNTPATTCGDRPI